MNTDTLIRDLMITYVEHALGEVKLLHSPALIGPTLAAFHITQGRAPILGFRPSRGKNRFRSMFDRYATYAIHDSDGNALGEPLHETELNQIYAVDVMERAIAANLGVMIMDHADLVTLVRNGGGGTAATSFTYKPARGLAERTVEESERERAQIALVSKLADLNEDTAQARRDLNHMLQRTRELDGEVEERKLRVRELAVQEAKAQRVLERERQLQLIKGRRRGEVPSPWDTNMPKAEDHELGHG